MDPIQVIMANAMSELLIRAFKDQKRPSQHNVSGKKIKLN